MTQQTQRARALRKNATDAERLLWQYLRNRQIGGYKYRRQHPISGYFADFACEELKLVVELDGGQHAEQVAYDTGRTTVLKRLGYKVVRFWNHEVLVETDVVLSRIACMMEERERELGIARRGLG